jgi:hypothetical protein
VVARPKVGYRLLLTGTAASRSHGRMGAMTRKRVGELTALEGRQVSVALRDGDRLDDVQLVSAGRNRAGTLWLFTNGADRFVAVDDVIDVWEAFAPGRPLAA